MDKTIFYHPKLPVTLESINMRLAQWEHELLTPGGSSSISWAGITLSWVAGSKREGNILKRGKTYGRIVYSDYKGKEIPRAVVIEEAMKPEGLRQAEKDIQNMLICSICNAVGMGFEQQLNWRRISLDWVKFPGKTEQEYDVKQIAICPKCILEIATGGIKRNRHDMGDKA